MIEAGNNISSHLKKKKREEKYFKFYWTIEITCKANKCLFESFFFCDIFQVVMSDMSTRNLRGFYRRYVFSSRSSSRI